MTILDKFSLHEKNAIVTGGARGLGFAMAEAMAQAGARIIICDIDLPAAQEAATYLCRYGKECMAVQLDVTNETQVETAISGLSEELGHLDILLNNAGICEHIDTQEMRLKNWQTIMNVNLNGVFLMAKVVGKRMIQQGAGSIINI